MNSLLTRPQRLLIIQTAFLGDAILTTPLIRGLKEIFPQTGIDILAIPETQAVFQNNPHLDRVYLFDKRRKSNKYPALIKVVRQLRGTQYDAAISVQGSLTSSLIMLLAGIPVRIGFDNQKLITHPVLPDRSQHATRRHLSLLQPFSDRTYSAQTEVFWSAQDEQLARRQLKAINPKGQTLIGLAPGSIWKTKRWPKENFIALIKRLQNHPLSFFLIGGPSDRDLCSEIEQTAGGNLINTAGRLPVPASAALISKLNLLVTNDSAPLHLANAVKTDVLAIFGPTVRDFGFYPFRENDQIAEIDLYCRPCGKHGGNRCPEKHFRCMLEISPERVAEMILSRIAGK